MLWGQSCHVHRSLLYCSQKTYIPKLNIKIQLLLWHNFSPYSNLYRNWHGLIYSCWKPSLCYVSPDRLFHLYLRTVMYAIVTYRKMQKQPLQNLFKLNSECILFVFWESRHNEPVCTKSVYFLVLLRRINCHLVRKGKDLETELKETDSWYHVCNPFWLYTWIPSSTGHFMMNFFQTCQQWHMWYLKSLLLSICPSYHLCFWTSRTILKHKTLTYVFTFQVLPLKCFLRDCCDNIAS